MKSNRQDMPIPQSGRCSKPANILRWKFGWPAVCQQHENNHARITLAELWTERWNSFDAASDATWLFISSPVIFVSGIGKTGNLFILMMEKQSFYRQLNHADNVLTRESIGSWTLKRMRRTNGAVAIFRPQTLCQQNIGSDLMMQIKAGLRKNQARIQRFFLCHWILIWK